MRLPIARSLAHFGTSPQCSIAKARAPSSPARTAGHVLGRRDVVARLERGHVVERERAPHGLGRGEECVAAAHGDVPYSRMPVPRFMSTTTIVYIATAKAPMITNATPGSTSLVPRKPWRNAFTM